MLSKISFVGVDAFTHLDNLHNLMLNEEISVEFAVLYSENRAGKENRYPTYNQTSNILNYLTDHDIKSSLHLCGKTAIDKFLSLDSDIHDLTDLCDTVQLNFNIDKYDHVDLHKRLVRLSNREIAKITLQYNDKNKTFIDNLNIFLTEFNILFDSSGGIGSPIDLSNLREAFFRTMTGYAGGINISNVIDVVKAIDKINNQEDLYYIDMESGIRDDNDLFSIEKCEEIIDSISNYYTTL